MINTFDMIVWFNGYERHYYNISRTAVKYFLAWHQENQDYQCYAVMDH